MQSSGIIYIWLEAVSLDMSRPSVLCAASSASSRCFVGVGASGGSTAAGPRARETQRKEEHLRAPDRPHSEPKGPQEPAWTHSINGRLHHAEGTLIRSTDIKYRYRAASKQARY